MAYLFTSGKFQAFNSAGAPLSGGKVYTYAAGTTSPLATYTTQAGDVANANPVILDSSGRADIWLGAAAYRLVVKTSADVVETDTDNIYPLVQQFAVLEETFTASAAQTLFNLSEFTYVVGNNSLSVVMNGIMLERTVDYEETSASSFTLRVAAEEGDRLIARAGVDMGANLANNAATVVYTGAGAGAVATTVQARLRKEYFLSDYGVTGDGVTDDTAEIQSAIDAVAVGGGGTLYFPRGSYAISAMLTVETGVRLIGEGYGDDDASATQPDTPATELLWIGSDSGTDPMVRFMSATASTYVYGAKIDGLLVNGNNAAYDGIVISSGQECAIGDVWVSKVRNDGIRLDDANGVLCSSVTINSYFYNAGANVACASSNGLVLRSSTGVGTTATFVGSIIAVIVNGNGLEIGDHDNGIFQKVRCRPSGTGHGVYLRGLTDGQTRVARKNFIGLFSGYDIYCEAGSINSCDWINSEGSQVTIATGAVLDYKVFDRNNGRRWRSHQYMVDDYRTLPLSDGYATIGTPTLTNTATAKARVVLMQDATAEEAWQWTVPPLRDWSGGRILGVLVQGQKSLAAGTGNVVFKIGGAQRTTAQNIDGATLTTENFTVAADDDGTRTLQEFTMTLATPWDCDAGSHFIFALSRLGTDGSDTLAQTFWITSVQLIYQADVADSEQNGVYRYQRSADSL